MFDLRLLFLNGIFLLSAIISVFYFFIIGEAMKAIFCIVITLFLLPIVFLKNKIKFYDGFCVLFSWKLIGMLPVIVEYKEIQEISKINKYKVKINHKTKTNAFVFDANKFISKINTYLK